MDPPSPPPQLLTPTTALSLLSTLLLLLLAHKTTTVLLPPSSPSKKKLLHTWHLFDALIHLTLEASFLYNCFFTHTLITPTPQSPLPCPPTTHPAAAAAAITAPFLGHSDRLYGSAYGTNAPALLWQEYARADRRWGGVDLTVVSLELLTVVVGGPLALWVCELLRRGDGRAWFWGTVLATGELYGGFMTFAPEWLTGSPNLDTSNFMYTWLYLFFFNMLWVVFPLWVLYEAYGNIGAAFAAKAEERGDGGGGRGVNEAKEKKKKKV